MAPLLGTSLNLCLVFKAWDLDCVPLLGRFDSELWLWRTSKIHTYLTFMCPCIANIVVNDDQKDAIIFGSFIYS